MREELRHFEGGQAPVLRFERKGPGLAEVAQPIGARPGSPEECTAVADRSRTRQSSSASYSPSKKKRKEEGLALDKEFVG